MAVHCTVPKVECLYVTVSEQTVLVYSTLCQTKDLCKGKITSEFLNMNVLFFIHNVA